jgi:integrase
LEMARPRFNGQASRAPNKRKLTDTLVRNLLPDAKPYLVWDLRTPGLAVAVHPTGTKTWKVIYPFRGRSRWYTIPGKVGAIDLEAARKLAVPVLLKVAAGTDPQAELKSQRGERSFEELVDRYFDEYAKQNNKSWRQADALIRKHLLPRWAKLSVSEIARSDVKAALAKIEKASVATQTLKMLSPVFTWGLKEEFPGLKANPCQRIDVAEGTSRERVLSDSEIPLFWAAFDDAGWVQSMALKTILLTGQRPGEVAHMRREHIVDGWWQMPGSQVCELSWPGTKNGENHRVWLPKPVQAIIAEMNGTEFVFAGARGKPIDLSLAMRAICAKLGVKEKVTPHDLRRTHGTRIAELGFGNDAINRIENHKDGGIVGVYNRHNYADENKKIMEAVATHIMALVEGKTDENVISAAERFAR